MPQEAYLDLREHGGDGEPAQVRRGAVESIGETVAGSGRPFVLAAGPAFLAPGRVATEQDRSPFHGVDSLRGGAENLALELAERGARTVVTRFAPTVHGPGDPGSVAGLVEAARARGAAGHIGDGANRWAAVHRSDAARVVQLALDTPAPAGSVLHAVAETGIPFRDIAGAIGRGLALPVVSVPAGRAVEHFGWLHKFCAADMAVDSAATRTLLGWTPAGPGLMEDLDGGSHYG